MDNSKQIRAAIFGISRLRCGIDGPGVTTLVLFMGCPLRCAYCLNDLCHEEVWEADGITPREGLMVMTPQELYEKVKIDNIYFQTTGGGICFGGGEPGFHVDFIEEFRRICPPRWKISVETCLHYGDDRLRRLAAVADHWIVDVKEMNDNIYRRYTGVESVVRRQLTRLCEFVEPKRITVRVPHIPGYNTDEDVRRSIEELQGYGFAKIEEFDYVVDVDNEV